MYRQAGTKKRPFSAEPRNASGGVSSPTRQGFASPYPRQTARRLFFGYTKWHQYGAQLMIPFISHSPFIFWLYPAFGIRGGARFLGASEWVICALLYAGFWDKRFGIVGALGSTITFFTTLTIIPFMPNGWDPAAGFPAMAGAVPFLMKDLVLLAVSIYLLKQDVIRLSVSSADAEIVSSRLAPARANKPTAAA